MKPIYMAGADVGDLEISYVTDALKNGWYENKYQYVEKFESEFAEFHGRKYALMTPNCTSAIQLILAGLGVGPGDEVIVPECTWIASSVGAFHLGANIVFCDIDPKTWCIDTKILRERITKRTKAIIAVDLFGNMANWNELDKISYEYGIPVIEDAAESLGSTYFGRKAGSFGAASVFSFHNTKTITTGEGGMLLLDHKPTYDACVKYRDLGRGPETLPYYNELVGFKFMPFNVQAALGLAQFHRLEELLLTKRFHFEYYRDRLEPLGVQVNYEDQNIHNGAWITGAVFPSEYGFTKSNLIKNLQELGVPARPFFYPLSSIPAYSQEKKYKVLNPNSYDISERGINLPGASNLTEDQLDFICKGVEKVVKSSKKKHGRHKKDLG